MTYKEAYQNCETKEDLSAMVKDDLKTAMLLNADRVPEINKAYNEVMKDKFKKEAFEEALKPMEEFVNTFCCPHDYVVITQGHAEIVEGIMATQLKTVD